MRRFPRQALAAAAVCVALTASARAQLKIVLMHCGQGNAAFIQSPSGKSAIIDASLSTTEGNNLLSFIRDTVAYGKTSLRHLDYTFIGHYHADHITGMDEVIDGLGRDSILAGCYDRGGSYTTGAYDDYVAAAGAKRTTSTLGQLFDLGPGITLRTVCMNGQVWNGGSVSTTDENTSSLGLLLTYGGFKMVIATDIAGANSSPYKDVESLLAPVVGRVTAMVVNHHGSATSSNATWCQTLHPRISVISCATNSYGHPTATAITNLTAVDSNYIYQTQPGSGAAIPAGRGVITNSNIWLLVNSTSVTVHYGNKDSTYQMDPLAVEFASFTASCANDAVELSWRTESETGCYRWEVERSGGPGAGFAVIGTAAGHGTTGVPQSYRYTDNTPTIDGVYYYRLAEIGLSGEKTYHGPVTVAYNRHGVTEFLAGPAWPNPAGGPSSISYQLPLPGRVSLGVYDIMGQRVRTLFNGDRPAGRHTATWDGRDKRGQRAASGVYLYRIEYQDGWRAFGPQRAVKKLVLTR